MVLKTKRLILRPWEETDAEELYKYAKDPQVGPSAGWPPHESERESLEIIRRVLSVPETYAIVPIEKGKPVGCISIMLAGHGNTPMAVHEAEIGFWLGVPYWGQGLVPEAVEKMLERCFENLGCMVVWCGYYEGNEKSRRVQEKCGFVYHHTDPDRQLSTGEVRPLHMNCLTRKRWQEVFGECRG